MPKTLIECLRLVYGKGIPRGYADDLLSERQRLMEGGLKGAEADQQAVRNVRKAVSNELDDMLKQVGAERPQPVSTPAAPATPAEPPTTPPPPGEMVGLGSAVYGERGQGMPPVLERSRLGREPTKAEARTAAGMEKKVKLPAQVNVEKVNQQFEQLVANLGDSLTEGGQFLTKELRPDIAKGIAAELGTVTSKTVQQYFINKFSALYNELRRLRADIGGQATPEQAAYYDLVLERAKHSFRQIQELRRTAHESLNFWNRIKAEYTDIAMQLKLMGELERRLPVLDRLWKNAKTGNIESAFFDFLEYARINLFTLGSWTLDFMTNTAVAAQKMPAYLISDSLSLARGRPAYEMAAALTAIRRNGRNLVPGMKRFRLPDEIETGLGTTAGGEIFGYGKEVMVDFSEILKNKPELANRLKEIDRIIAAPVRMKRGIDNFYGRLGATTELYHQAYESAAKLGLKGEDFRTAVENFVREPPKEAINRALEQGKEWKFNRELTVWEEKIARRPEVKMVLDVFPRWGFQFIRWAGESLGANPTIYRKIRNRTATQRDVVDALTKAATGWGAIIFFDQLFYDDIDPNTMEYIYENGDRVRLSGRTPMPELYALNAMLRGDMTKAKQAFPYTSVPFSRFMAGESGGLISPVIGVMGESWSGRYTAERTSAELTKLLNNLIPGKSTLGFVRSLYDPTVREGLGAPVPGMAQLLPQRIDPTTGEPLAPTQRIPGTGITLPTVGGTPFPGAVRDLNKIQAVLLNHGLGSGRPRRTWLIETPPEDVPASLRREYEQRAGQNVKQILGDLIDDPRFWTLPFDARREVLQQTLSASRTLAKQELAQKYGKDWQERKRRPLAVEMLPERLKK